MNIEKENLKKKKKSKFDFQPKFTMAAERTKERSTLCPKRSRIFLSPYLIIVGLRIQNKHYK